MDAMCGNTFEMVFFLFPFFALLYSCQDLFYIYKWTIVRFAFFNDLVVSSVFLEGCSLSLHVATSVCVVFHYFETL